MREQTAEIRLPGGDPENRPSTPRLHAASCLLIVLLSTLGGCIQPPARIAAQPPPYHFQPATLRAIDERLVSYLQEQFYEQVLEPVSRYVDPQTVMEETAVNYLRELSERLDRLPSAYDVPAFAVRQHLETIPAIFVQEVPPRQASLYEVMHTDDLPDLPAYQALLKKEVASIRTG